MHECPDCGQACSCSGDIEDHDTGDEFYVECDHCGPRLYAEPAESEDDVGLYVEGYEERQHAELRGEHAWVPSTLGHGERMCANCKITNREAAVLGEQFCSQSPRPSGESGKQ